MNESALLFASSLANALAFSSYNLFKMYKKHKHKHETFIIVGGRHSGISTQVSKLRAENPEFNKAILVDEDDVVEKQPERMRDRLLELRDTNQDSYMCEVFPLIREHLQNLRAIYGNRPIILFTSLMKLPQFLEIKDKRCLLLYTSSDFHSELIEGFRSDGKPHDYLKRMSDTRDMLLSQPYERVKYRNFGELSRVLESMLFGRSGRTMG